MLRVIPIQFTLPAGLLVNLGIPYSDSENKLSTVPLDGYQIDFIAPSSNTGSIFIASVPYILPTGLSNQGYVPNYLTPGFILTAENSIEIVPGDKFVEGGGDLIFSDAYLLSTYYAQSASASPQKLLVRVHSHIKESAGLRRI